MARFPLTEGEIVLLAHSVASGLTAQPGIFPDPPVAAGDLAAAVEAYKAAKVAVFKAQAAHKEAVRAKDAALRALKTDLRCDLRYAEYTAGGDAGKLATLGWNGRAARTRLAVPGQPGLLVMTEQEKDRVVLRWKKPDDGGEVSAYAVERRVSPDGVWEPAGMAVKPQAVLENQPRGRDLQYRVMAVNKAGAGPAGNTVSAVL